MGTGPMKKFLTYGQRQRRVVAGFRAYFLEAGRPMVNDDQVRENLRRFPSHFDLFVRRSEVDNVFPTPLLPSLTITAETMGGLRDFPTELPTNEFAPTGSLPD